MQTKVKAGGLGGAVSVVLVWVLNTLVGLDIPPEVASAFTVIVSTGLGYFVKEQ